MSKLILLPSTLLAYITNAIRSNDNTISIKTVIEDNITRVGYPQSVYQDGSVYVSYELLEDGYKLVMHSTIIYEPVILVTIEAASNGYIRHVTAATVARDILAIQSYRKILKLLERLTDPNTHDQLNKLK